MGRRCATMVFGQIVRLGPSAGRQRMNGMGKWQHGDLHKDVDGRTKRARASVQIAKCYLVHATNRDTPPKDVICRGRSPGLRVTASVWPSRCASNISDPFDKSSPLTVAGAAPAWPVK